MRLVTPEEIRSAADRLAGRVVRTPVLPCPRLSDDLGVEVHVKAENLQWTGSFKPRGVLNHLLIRAERGELPSGVATFSAGNHAAATAFAASQLGIPAVVCMPPDAVRAKVELVQRYGAELIHTADLFGTARTVAAERGYALLHPFDDLDVIAGQATVGHELITDLPSAGLVLVPVGGGGLISGVAAAVRAAAPHCRVVGVEPVTANAMSHALRAGAPEPLPQRPVSLADGLTAPFAGAHPLAHVEALVEAVVEIPEEAVALAWWDCLDATKLLVEPSAGVGLAALRAGLVHTRPGEVVVLVLSGGNVGRAGLTALGQPAPSVPG